jgi:hypothetical protein
LIVSLPGIITFLVLILDTSGSLAQFLGSGVLLLIVVYPVSFLVRHLGKEVEPGMWRSWDGPPSTRFLRWRDTRFGGKTKRMLHQAVGHFCRIELLPPDDEERDPQEADRLISEAFGQVKATVRRDNAGGVWEKHNAEYGLQRNLLGSRVLWSASAAAGVLVCGTLWLTSNNDLLLIGAILNIIVLTWSLVWGWVFLPRFTKEAADAYAESVWSSFLVGAKSCE